VSKAQLEAIDEEEDKEVEKLAQALDEEAKGEDEKKE
jgi:hypothetical protein